MKKQLAITIILLIFFTICHVLLGGIFARMRNQIQAEIALADQKLIELIQIKYTLISSDDIFRYISIRNPKLSNREISEIVAHAFYLGDLTGADPYGILTIMDIESNFDPGAVGQSHQEISLMQLTPKNWKDYHAQYGFKYEDKDDWRCTTTVAAYHFAWLVQKYNGNIVAAIGQYNAGPKWETNEKAKKHISRFKVAFEKILRYREKGI